MLLPIVRAQWTSQCLLLFAYAGFTLFLYGFFPLKYHGGSETTWDDLPANVNGVELDSKKLYVGNRSRVVIMVIDALRYDFVNSELMPFTYSLINKNEACIYKARAEPPTVTMPRIKAMTTGSISNFIDVALNFGSPAVTEDNFLHQAKINNKVLVFYGDDTWISLFPSVFHRSEGTTSFYVTDYTEVDLNVTRHLTRELPLSNPDWDLLILHYLGLDHIGHIEGPSSPKVLPKMLEMDSVVQTIINASKKWDDDTIFILCGDHGMKDSGSHGGASYSEIMVPLVITQKKGCSKKANHEIDQIDLAPTVSYLLGVPIPNASTGQILPQLLSHDSSGELYSESALYALYYNAKVNSEALIKILGKNEALNKECYKRYLSAVKYYGDWLKDGKAKSSSGKIISDLFMDSMMNMAHYLTKSLVEFDVFAIVWGIIIIAQTFVVQVMIMIAAFNSDLHGKTSDAHIYKRKSIFLRGTLMFFMVIACCFIFKITCGISQTNSSLCKLNIISLPTVICMISIIITNQVIIQNIKDNYSFVEEINKLNVIETFLIVCTIIHPLTYGGTSFIEEEHQTWYFFWSSITFLIFTYTGKILIIYYHKRKENSTEVQDKVHLNTKMDTTAKRLLPQWLLLMIAHRFLRTLNQTGDKWAFLPDVGDWLNKDENNEILSLFSLAALFSTTYICQNNLHWTITPYRINCFLIIGCTSCVYLFRVSTQVIQVPYVGFLEMNEIFFVRIFWALILIMIVLELVSTRQYFMERFATFTSQYKQNSEPSSTAYLNKNYAFISHDTNYDTKDESSSYQLSDVAINFNVQNSASSNFILSGTAASIKLEIFKSRITVFLNAMMLICSLYLRPHNHVLVPTIFCTSKLVNKVLNYEISSKTNIKKEKSSSKNLFCKCVFHFWIGSVFYFYQGNSNSLASIDLGSGYIGLESYIPPIVALQMGMHTYTGPLLGGLLLFTTVAQENHDWKIFLHQLRGSVSALSLLRIYPLLIYTIICALFRYHLFVWTVFSPKLLYEFTLTFFCVTSFFVLITMCYSVLIQEKLVVKFYSTKSKTLHTT